MPDRDGYIAGVPCWVDTSQPDPAAAAEFYSALFGWETEDVMPADSPVPYFIARIRGRDVAAISGQQREDAPSWNTYVQVDSADATADKVREAGGTVLTEPFDVMDSGRMAVFADPQGAVFYVWQPREHLGSRVVNEHGSVNFNDLRTSDVEGAKAFYGAVFGWSALEMGGNFFSWTLPGYGDHLEELNPGMRERMAEMGAPAGFEDVVASLGAASGGEPSHWGVIFGVDDADAIAAKAGELGATVVAPPFDAPWVRTTVIADPQGATFVANQFVLENKDLPAPEGSATAS
jgi:predicted enzyme related to lactoylglutathione lyase